MTSLEEAYNMGRTMMNENGLDNWALEFNNAYTTAGLCSEKKRTIYLSRPVTLANSLDHARETMAHETAHAIVGVKHGHDAVWARQSIALGGNGDTTLKADDVVVPPGRYVGTCPTNPKHMVQRYRRTKDMVKGQLFCGKCHVKGDFERGRLVWTER